MIRTVYSVLLVVSISHGQATGNAATGKSPGSGGYSNYAFVSLDAEEGIAVYSIDPSNKFLFIPCRMGEAIPQFRFNEGTGMLIPNNPDQTLTPPKTGPRHFAFHPSLGLVYFVNEFDSSVTAYRMGGSDGNLSEIQTLSSLPAGFARTNTSADIHITPVGGFS